MERIQNLGQRGLTVEKRRKERKIKKTSDTPENPDLSSVYHLSLIDDTIYGLQMMYDLPMFWSQPK